MYREPIVMRRKLGLKSMVWTRRKERNIQPEKNEETRIQTYEERLRNLQDILKRSNIQIIGEKRKKSKKLKSYLNK